MKGSEGNHGKAIPVPLGEEYVSIRSIARACDASRRSVRRWLSAAGIHPAAFGNSRKGAIRYRRREIESWLQSRPVVKQ